MLLLKLLDDVLVNLFGHIVQVVLIRSQSARVNLSAVKEYSNNLARMLSVLLRNERVDEISNPLPHFWRDHLRLRLLFHWHWLLSTTKSREVCLHHNGLLHLLWLLTSGTLATIRDLSLPWAALIFSAASAALVSTTTRLLLTLRAFHAIRSRRIEELLHLTPLALVTLFSQLLRRLPELNAQKAGSEHIGLVKFLDSFLGGIYVGVQNKILNVSWVTFDFSLTCPFFQRNNGTALFENLLDFFFGDRAGHVAHE